MRVLLIDDIDPFRQYLVTSLENGLPQSDLMEATTLRVAKLVFDSDPYFEAVFCSLDIKEGNILEFIHHLQKNYPSVPIITYTDQTEPIEIPSTFLLSKKELKNFESAMSKVLPMAKKLVGKKEEKQTHAHIRLFYLWRFEYLPFDLYLKLNDQKFVKILKANEPYDSDFIEKYQSQDMDYLYLEQTDYPLLEELLYSDQWFDSDSNLTPEQRDQRLKKIIQMMATSIGLSPYLIEQAQEVVDNVIKDVNESQKLSKIFKRIHDNGSYKRNNSTLISYLTSALCDELKWTTKSSKEKLAFAALFHDIAIKETKLCSLTYSDDRVLKGMDEDKRKTYFQHPIQEAELVKELDTKYPQVGDIIIQHHERPDGSGFPKGLTHHNIPALSSLFIVAQDYVMRASLSDFKKTPSEIIEEIAPVYTEGHFKKCLSAMRKLLDS